MSEKVISYKEINRLAIPAIVSGIAEPLIALADTAMIGTLGTVALGATGLGSSFFLLLVWILTQTKTAISSIVAKAYGKGDLDVVKPLIPQVFFFNILLGLIAGVIFYRYSIFFLEELYEAKNELLFKANQYFSIRLYSLPIVMATYTIFGIFRGVQNTAWTMGVSLAGGIVNLILDIIFIFGFGSIPAMGIEGAAWASVMAHVVMFLLAIYFLFLKTDFKLNLTFDIHPQFSNFLALSSGFIVRTAALNAAFVLSNKFATRYNETSIATHTIAINIWLFSAYFIDGYANAGNALAGRLFGQKKYDVLYRTGIRLMNTSILIGGLLGAVYAMGYFNIPKLFSQDPKVLSLFAYIFWLVIISQPINAVAFAFDGIFKGLGESSYLMYTLIIATFLGFVPILYLLDYYGWELQGIWWAFFTMMVIRAGTLVWKFRRDYLPYTK